VADTRHYPELFSPLRIGPLELRNRLLMSAMTTGFGFDEGAPDDRALAYFAARTKGVALAVVAFGAVAPEGRVEEKIPWMWRDDAAEVMRPLAAAIRAQGALPCLQLGHGGRQVSPRVIGGAPVGPSPLAIAVHNTEVPPRALTIEEIGEIVSAFGRAARKAADAGFAAVEIHGAHGYLIQQFLSPQSNERTDRYGGATVTERARFGMEVIAEVRRAAPELAVIVRINGSDVVPGGLTPSDAAEAAAAFVAAGAQALLVSAGVYGSVPYTIPLLDDAEATFLESAAFIKQAVDVPVIAVGRFTLPATADAAVKSGQCDAVAIGRGLLADAEWVAKAAAGRAADIRPCIATVQGCAGMLQHGGEISCAVNPSVGRESLPIVRPTGSRSVVVIGGGPAGLESARRAAELGHRVVLHERAAHLGGAMTLAAQTPVLGHLRRLITWYERQLDTLGVEVRLGSDATAADGATADLVVVAVGGSTAVPLVDGYEHLPAWTLEDLMSGEPSSLGPRPLPARPVVLGGGSRALSLALWLALGGAEPTVLSNGRFGTDNSGLTRRALQTRLSARGVPMLVGRATALLPGAVTWVDPNGRTGQLEADGLVVSEPVQPNRFDAGSLARVVSVGDARRVGDIPAAVTDGRDAIDAFTREAVPARS
jgi:2,4-dienoyl-CoA reductase-like NADH-dependent reductase (Old Yellow Enzyme family)/thioredoxin reductase